MQPAGSGLALPAFFPVAVLLVLLLGLGWTVVRTAAAGFLAAALAATSFFRTGPDHAAMEALKGLWNSVSIIIVILPAILIYEISLEAGAFPAIRREVARLIRDPLLRILALGWCFSSFLQGPSGFGVPIAVTAPLLVAIGVKPLWAVAIPLLGHAWANTFGTLGLAWEALVRQVGLSAPEWAATAFWTGVFLFGMNLLAGLTICWFHGGAAGLRHGLPAAAALSLIMGGGQLALAEPLPSLAATIPTTVALAAVFAIARMDRYARPPTAGSRLMEAGCDMETDCDGIGASGGGESGKPEPAAGIGLHQAMFPYYALTIISTAILMLPPLKVGLGRFATSFSFPAAVTGLGFTSEGSEHYSPIAWFTHSGFFLLLSALAAGCYYLALGAVTGKGVAAALSRTWRKALPASLSVALLIGMSKIMGGSGQTDALAGPPPGRPEPGTELFLPPWGSWAPSCRRRT